VEIKSEATNKAFKVNGHRLKTFHESPTLEEEIVEEVSLEEPSIPFSNYTLTPRVCSFLTLILCLLLH
ncbi:integrase, partial [Trifolium medium]|nr:integrase [Trifolium medium]